MDNPDDQPAPLDSEPPKMNAGWQRRMKLMLAAALACVLLMGAVLLAGRLTHRPQYVFPPEVQTALPFQPGSGSRILVDKEYADKLKKTYNLDECQEGQRLMALCQDGELHPGSTDDICAEHGGVKSWVECR